MNLSELITRTKLYTRDTSSAMFTEQMVSAFLNEAIDRVKSYPVFKNMNYLKNMTDIPNLLPSNYHYILALYSSSRCFDFDERFYEAAEKRNEFENMLLELINDIEIGNIDIYDENNELVENTYNVIDAVVDIYFDGNSGGGEDA